MNENSLSFTIIIPTYNCKKVISDAINSVVLQTFSNYEIVCVDGASVDGTVEVLNEYANKYSFVRVLSEPDSGIYDAMNKGVSMAEGDWILFLGADDKLYSKHTLETVYRMIKSNNFDFVYGDVVLQGSTKIYDGRFNLFKLNFKNICHQAIFYHNRLFAKGNTFDIDLRVNADWEFNLKCFLDPTIRKKYIPIVISEFNETGTSSNTEDDIVHRRQQLRKRMPYWIRVFFKYRHTKFVRLISRFFLNNRYA
ncbi:glycosyltransferase family 2 protein [Robertkochia solimangrovi]|uniref:glycosyltransferase family 2 protein n=1 Tax=Robertkochia solimangrovi TaxID=2213046 RepID=UPI00117F4802|nr:glycosyltransferase family 2 protein [Robertkochia solimangrovi]TRZ44979.1 glycosyltransferase [Robertkochia solimangrovi]